LVVKAQSVPEVVDTDPVVDAGPLLVNVKSLLVPTITLA
jgi:hypothetical protein